jgi:hypothetical protein
MERAFSNGAVVSPCHRRLAAESDSGVSRQTARVFIGLLIQEGADTLIPSMSFHGFTALCGVLRALLFQILAVFWTSDWSRLLCRLAT